MFINGFDILWDEIDDYVADIKSIRSIDQFTFTKPVTFFCGENGSGKSTLLEDASRTMNLCTLSTKTVNK